MRKRDLPGCSIPDIKRATNKRQQWCSSADHDCRCLRSSVSSPGGVGFKSNPSLKNLKGITMIDTHIAIWRDVPVRILTKITHIRKISGKLYRRIIRDYGDLPTITINPITNNFESVVNNRGYAYAKRNDVQWRKGKYLRDREIPFLD
jgi:hypothetical protein